jgi:hypothetical protein
MTGQELYERYTFHLSTQGVGTDAWDEIEESDRLTWDMLADEIFSNV